MFIPRSRKINLDVNNNDLSINITTNKSTDIISRMYDSITTNNLEAFKKIYNDEYLCDPEVFDYFKYEDENNNWWVNTYSLCKCSNKNTEPEHIHRNMNIRKCNCVNGKRYLAYLNIFNSQLGCICYDTNPTTIFIDTSMDTNFTQYLQNSGPLDLTYTQFCYLEK